MGTIAEFNIPADDFALGPTFQELPNLEVEIERLVAHDHDRVMPFAWLTTADPDDLDRLDDVLSADSTVDSYESISKIDGDRLYRMEWIDATEMIVHILLEEEGTILHAMGQSDGWHVRVLFPDRDSLSRTYDFADEHGMRFDVVRIYALDDDRKGRFGLTDEQQDTLAAATKLGYYDVPRRITQAELAEKLGVSHQALSERLRRAQKTLNENTVIIGDAEGDEPDLEAK
ncbi:helix-turn-helix domain-containing protein [Halalkalicoccus salilacus]|uniref:helix-turn-helix domain-containing protein n=1 Tax=Halalkalicoccus salilacus TaxID=3117459 RepID=UPI00300E83D6